MQLFRDDESKGPMLSCQNASFNIDTKDAQLTGSVQVEFPDGGFFSTEIGMLLGGGRRFESGTSVTFVGQRLLGRAGSVNYDMADEVLRLGDGVVIRSDEMHSLTAASIEYRRREGQLVLAQGATMVFAGITLTAPSGKIDLEEGEQLPRRVVFSGGVSISGRDPSNDQIIRARAERFEAERDAEDRWQVKATTLGPWVDVEFYGGDNVLFQGLRAWNLRAVAGREDFNMVAEGGVCLENVALSGERRFAESDTLRVWFDNGRTSDVELQKDVVIREGDIVATAHRARVDSLNEQVMLHGNPIGRSSRVTLVSQEGRLVADQALLTRLGGTAEARGRVQGEMYGVSLVGDDRASEHGATETVHIACGRLTVSDDGEEYILRDSARAWQGQRLLVADEIRYHRGQRRMEAKGHARTTFPARMLDPDAESAEDVVLSARSITFDDARSRAVYQGDVVYKDARQTMTAALLEVEISDGDVSSVVATGSVEIQSFETGQRLTGNVVVHEVSTGDFHLTGEPAQAIDGIGNMLQGVR